RRGPLRIGHRARVPDGADSYRNLAHRGPDQAPDDLVPGRHGGGDFDRADAAFDRGQAGLKRSVGIVGANDPTKPSRKDTLDAPQPTLNYGRRTMGLAPAARDSGIQVVRMLGADEH